MFLVLVTICQFELVASVVQTGPNAKALSPSEHVSVRVTASGVPVARKEQTPSEHASVEVTASGVPVARKEKSAPGGVGPTTRVRKETGLLENMRADDVGALASHISASIEARTVQSTRKKNVNLEESVARKGQTDLSTSNTALVDPNQVMCPTLAALVRNGDIALDPEGRASQKSLKDALSFLNMGPLLSQGFIKSPVSLQQKDDFNIALTETNGVNRVCTGIRSPVNPRRPGGAGDPVSPNVTRFAELASFGDDQGRLFAKNIAQAYRKFFVDDVICERTGGGPGAFAEIPTLLLVFGTDDTSKPWWDPDRRFLSVDDLRNLLIEGRYPESKVVNGALQTQAGLVDSFDLVGKSSLMTLQGYPLADATFRS